MHSEGTRIFASSARRSSRRNPKFRSELTGRLSAEEDHHSETLETLKFAGNCARVETKAKKNIVRRLLQCPSLHADEI